MDRCLSDRYPPKGLNLFKQGWWRRFDKEIGCVIWRFWRTAGGLTFHFQCVMSAKVIESGGRVWAAKDIKQGRYKMRLAIAEHLRLSAEKVEAEGGEVTISVGVRHRVAVTSPDKLTRN